MSLAALSWNYQSPIDNDIHNLSDINSISHSHNSSIASPLLISTSAATSIPSSTSVLTSPLTPPSSDSAFYTQSLPLPPKISKMTVAHAAVTTTAPAATKRRRSTPVKPLELSQEDDWTKVKDPKEKKRIQNRVAQRTYRHRMKARLGELQARLDSHERRFFHQTTPEDGDVSGSNGGLPSSLLIPTNKVMMPAGGEATNLFQEAPKFSGSPPPSLHSPQSQPQSQSNGLLSPPKQSIHGRDAKLPQEFVFDCMRFQSQVLNRLNTLQSQDQSYVAPYGNGDGVPSMLGDISPTEPVPCVGAFTPTDSEGMDFAFDASVDVWKSEALGANKPPLSPNPTDPLEMQGLAPHASSTGATLDPTIANFHHNQHDPQSMMRRGSYQPPLPGRNASLDERLERVMEVAEAERFESFDTLVAAYYCHTFDETSPLANEQRLSRNRRLPKVISDVFRATGQWTQWERRGFEEEILKTAESMVLTESANARRTLINNLTPLIEAEDGSNGNPPAVPVEVLLHNLKRSIQHEIPDSWALTMALASENRTSWQKDRSNTALATTLLLMFGGRLPNETLLRLIDSCL